LSFSAFSAFSAFGALAATNWSRLTRVGTNAFSAGETTSPASETQNIETYTSQVRVGPASRKEHVRTPIAMFAMTRVFFRFHRSMKTPATELSSIGATVAVNVNALASADPVRS